MTKPIPFNPATHTIGLNRKLEASKVPERPDPPIPIDGDEILYLISGRVRVVYLAPGPNNQFRPIAGDG